MRLDGTDSDDDNPLQRQPQQLTADVSLSVCSNLKRQGFYLPFPGSFQLNIQYGRKVRKLSKYAKKRSPKLMR